MTDANLMDANCIHGNTWWECEVCDRLDAVLEAESDDFDLTDEDDERALLADPKLSDEDRDYLMGDS